MANCTGGIPSRKIVCMAGEPNTCLANCSDKCAKYESKVRYIPRAIPVQPNSGQDAGQYPNPIRDMTSSKAANIPLTGSFSENTGTFSPMQAEKLHAVRQQMVRDRIASLPAGTSRNCGNCGSGSVAAMR